MSVQDYLGLESYSYRANCTRDDNAVNPLGVDFNNPRCLSAAVPATSTFMSLAQPIALVNNGVLKITEYQKTEIECIFAEIHTWSTCRF